MFHVYCSPDLRILADHLIDKLAHRKRANPLVSDTVIVPNRETARWFTHRCTDKLGVTANINWFLPSEWSWSLIRHMHPNLPLLLSSDTEPLQWQLFSLFSQKKLRKKFPVVESYLEGLEDTVEAGYRWQLANKIASAFDQYQVYRPDMLLRWERGEVDSQEERWQADLWNLLVHLWQKQGRDRLSKHRADYYLELLDYLKENRNGDFLPLCLFNPGRLTVPFLELVSTYAMSGDLDLYSVTTRPAGSPNGEPSDLFKSFGEEMSVSRTLLEEFVAPQQIHHLKPSAGAEKKITNLTRIQKSVVSDSPFPAMGEDDGSIAIHSCHNPLREVETLRDTLLELFSEQAAPAALKPEDVLVVAPDLREYQPFIDAVFSIKESGLPQIPYHVALPEPSESGGYSRAFLHLLEIPASRLAFEEVLEFINHQPVRDSFRITTSDIGTIRRWFSDNRVLWGINARHRSLFNQPKTDINTWESALNRGWIGQLAGGEPGELVEDDLPYTGIDNADHQLLWAKVQKLLGLLEKTIHVSRRTHTCKEWSTFLKSLVKALFKKGDSEDIYMDQLLTSVGSLESETEVAGFDDVVPFDIIRQRLTALFEDQRTGSVFFTRGVTFSQMVPVRSIPFRMIAFLGLNHDQFPRRSAENPIDLITKYPKKGERDRKNVDRNLFLEAILAADDIFWCSYVGKSQQDNESIPPSPILEEWIRLLNSSRPKNTPSIVKQESLHGFSPTNFSQENAGISKQYLEAASVIRSGSAEKGFYRGEKLPDPETEEPVTLTDLELFYNNPLKYFCNNKLNIYLRSSAEEDDGEFQATLLDRHVLFQSIFNWKLKGKTEREIEAFFTRSGYLPAGWPGGKTFDALMHTVSLALEELGAVRSAISPTLYELGTELSEPGLAGSVTSLSDECLLELNPSRCNGKHLLVTWIRHLALSASGLIKGERCLMLFGLRENKPVWKFFQPVSHPEELLSELTASFKLGLTCPLPLFPETAFHYIDSIKKGIGEAEAMDKAIKSEWSKVNFKNKRKFGNQADPYTTFLYGANADLAGKISQDFRKTANNLFSPLVDHLSEGTE